jgi:hypothetical protein
MALTFTKGASTAPSKFIQKADGTQVLPAGTVQQKWTDTKSILSPGLMIAYKNRPGYPSQPQKELLLAAASATRTIMLKAVRELDRVVFLRRPEGQVFTNIMNYHFGLAAGRAAGLPSSNVVDKPFGMKDIGATDRRWALNKIREGMLSLSFHLNTGMYLIDCDNEHRTIKSGAFKGVAGTLVPEGEEGYCTWSSWSGLDSGLLSAWRNGEIHVAFKNMHESGYSAKHYARVIIHEAAHKYLGVTDVKYAHQQAEYTALGFSDCLNNADSYAWAALSLEAGFLLRGVDSHDNKGYPGNIP